MNKLETKSDSNEDILTGLIDTHIHTSPDVKPRLLDDYEAALDAQEKGMQAIVLKSHVEPTVGRSYITHKLTGFQVFGGITLNQAVGGFNPEAVKISALMGGKIIWFPTIHHKKVELNYDLIEEIVSIIKEYNLILATGHLDPQEIFQVIDLAKSQGVEKILINHPLTRVVGASIDQQKEMSRNAYLEHCWVATMPQHDRLSPELIFEAINEVGVNRCILATDFGQKHNPQPSLAMKSMIETMLKYGISWKEIQLMCKDNPEKLLF